MHCLAHLKNPAANREATVAICSSDLLDRKTGPAVNPLIKIINIVALMIVPILPMVS